MQRRTWSGLKPAMGTGKTTGDGGGHTADSMGVAEKPGNVYGGMTDSCITGSNGFKYGIAHTEALYTDAKFRRNRFGQFRDMLEQRPYTAFYDASRSKNAARGNFETDPVFIKFVDSDGNQITGINTSTCQNISNNCTSSVPYFEGNARSGLTLTLGGLDVLSLLS